MPLLEQNERNCIRLLTNSDYAVTSKDSVDPAPDNTIRVFMEFYKAGKKIKIAPQIFNKVDRKGFVLTKWGGSDVFKIINTETTYKPVKK